MSPIKKKLLLPLAILIAGVFFIFGIDFIFGEKAQAKNEVIEVENVPQFIAQGKTPFAFYLRIDGLNAEGCYYLSVKINGRYGSFWRPGGFDNDDMKFVVDKTEYLSWVFMYAGETVSSGEANLIIKLKDCLKKEIVRREFGPIQILRMDSFGDGGWLGGHIYSDPQFKNPLQNTVVLLKDAADNLIGSYITEDNQIDEKDESYNPANAGYFKLASPTLDGLANSIELRDTNNKMIDGYYKTNGPWIIKSGEISSIDKMPSEPIHYNDILITELLPNPTNLFKDSEDEFIEIYNRTNQQIDLDGFVLQDERGTQFVIHDLILSPGGFKVFYSRETPITLNNDGDKISLFEPGGLLISETPDYGEAKDGMSYNLICGGDGWEKSPSNCWQWSVALTPGSTNFIFIPSPGGNSQSNNSFLPPLTSIQAAKKLDEGEAVCVEGVVTVTPGVLGTQIFYLQDSTAGIQIYSYHKIFPTLNIGDKIKVCGELGSGVVKRIKTDSLDDFDLFGKAQVYEPLRLDLNNLSGQEGQLVYTEGKILKKTTKYLLIDFGGQLKTYFKSPTDLKGSNYKLGQYVKITGILGKYSDEFQVWPRGPEDVEILSDESILLDDEMHSSSTIQLARKSQIEPAAKDVIQNQSDSAYKPTQISLVSIPTLMALADTRGIKWYTKLAKVIIFESLLLLVLFIGVNVWMYKRKAP